MYKKVFVLLIMVAIPSIIAGCLGCANPKQETPDPISDGPRNIIEKMMTCPNTELFSADMITVLGGQAEATDLEKEKAAALNEASYRNWEEAVGEYFGYGYFDNFINSGPASRFLADAELNGVSISVKEMALKERTDASETILVTYLRDSKELQVEMKFRYDLEGLIKDIEILSEIE